jgi:hypothetical protein
VLQSNGRADFTLEPNDGSTNLNLSIYSLTDNRFRIQVKEVNSSRYELNNVLDGPPPIVGYKEM